MATQFDYLKPKGSVPIDTRPMQAAAESQAASYSAIADAFSHSFEAKQRRVQETALQKSSQDFEAGQQAERIDAQKQRDADSRAFQFDQNASAEQSREKAQQEHNFNEDLDRQNRLMIADIAERRRIADEQRRAQDAAEHEQAYGSAKATISSIASNPENHFFQTIKVSPIDALYPGRQPEDVANEVRAQLGRDNPGMSPEDRDSAVQDYVKSLSKPRDVKILPGETHEALTNTVLQATAGDNPTPAQRAGVYRALNEQWGKDRSGRDIMPHDAVSALESVKSALDSEFKRNLGAVKSVAGKSVNPATVDREKLRARLEQSRQAILPRWQQAIDATDDPRTKAHLSMIRDDLADVENPTVSFLHRKMSEFQRASFPTQLAHAPTTEQAALLNQVRTGSDDDAKQAAVRMLREDILKHVPTIQVDEKGRPRSPEDVMKTATAMAEKDAPEYVRAIRGSNAATAAKPAAAPEDPVAGARAIMERMKGQPKADVRAAIEKAYPGKFKD